MNRQQVAGHLGQLITNYLILLLTIFYLGAANNPNLSSGTQHASRQAVMSSAAQGSSGRSQASIAGQIGA